MESFKGTLYVPHLVWRMYHAGDVLQLSHVTLVLSPKSTQKKLETNPLHALHHQDPAMPPTYYVSSMASIITFHESWEGLPQVSGVTLNNFGSDTFSFTQTSKDPSNRDHLSNPNCQKRVLIMQVAIVLLCVCVRVQACAST